MRHKNIWTLVLLAAASIMPAHAQDTLFIVTQQKQMGVYPMGDDAYITFNRPKEQEKDTLVRQIPKTMKAIDICHSSRHYDFGIPAIMHIRDIMAEDMATQPSGYDWFTSWSENKSLSAPFQTTYFVWKTYDNYISTANDVIARLQAKPQTTEVREALAQARTFRAHAYLEMGQMYEFMPTDVIPVTQFHDSISGNTNNILHLTVPIITQKTEPGTTLSVPRATKQELAAFIREDLDYAIGIFGQSATQRESIEMPNLGVAHGLLARLYMWTGNYEQAAQQASEAIACCPGKPLTQAEWTNIYTGFNYANSSWLWGIRMKKDDEAVQSRLLNWTSWMCNEWTNGYAWAGVTAQISKALYDKIGNKDFRKLSWVPGDDNSTLDYFVKYADPNSKGNFGTYASLKFRPANGNTSNYLSAAVDIPLMRVEEMYLIQAEAQAHLNAAEGKNLLNNFMQQYRDKSYRCTATTQDDIVKEIILQKRIELWGEGQVFFDYKRLNLPVTRAYEGSNFSHATRFNTQTYPAWMNFVFPTSAIKQNTALEGWNNPDPSGLYFPYE